LAALLTIGVCNVGAEVCLPLVSGALDTLTGTTAITVAGTAAGAGAVDCEEDDCLTDLTPVIETAGENCLADGGGESFSPDTTVATPSSETPIADLKPGDQVMAYDPKTGETKAHTVTAVMVHTDPATEQLQTDAGSIETTPNHPFFTTDRGWVEAGSLRVGEKVRTESGGSATVVGFSVDDHPSSMWDLTVDTAHSFFVGSGQVLVHNWDCLGLPRFDGQIR
jgi:hypothetical protein